MRKILNLLFIVLGFCILTDCGAPQRRFIYTTNTSPPTTITKRVIPIYVDRTFSTQDKLAIDNSINQWNYVLNKQIVLVVITYDFDMEPELIQQAQRDNGFLFLKVDSDNLTIPDDMPVEQCRHTPGCALTAAWTDRLGGSVLKIVRDRIAAKDVEYIVLHEIGHLFYLQHVPDSRLLMYETNQHQPVCIDQDAAYKVAVTYGLDTIHMNYCTYFY